MNACIQCNVIWKTLAHPVHACMWCSRKWKVPALVCVIWLISFTIFLHFMICFHWYTECNAFQCVLIGVIAAFHWHISMFCVCVELVYGIVECWLVIREQFKETDLQQWPQRLHCVLFDDGGTASAIISFSSPVSGSYCSGDIIILLYYSLLFK